MFGLFVEAFHIRVEIGPFESRLIYTPLAFLVLAVVVLAVLAARPRLIWSRVYVYLLTYSLAFWVTVEIYLDYSFLDTLWDYALEHNSAYRIASTLELIVFSYTFLVYPALYLKYAQLTIRAFDSLIGDIDIARVYPKLYWFTTVLAGALGVPMAIIGFLGLIFHVATAFLLYPGIGLILAAFWGKFKRKPYRFLLLFPLLGQSVMVRGIVDYAILCLLLEGLVGRILGLGDIASRLLEYIESASTTLAPFMSLIPGFGVIQAVLPAIYTGRSIPVISITSMLLFTEWLIFCKTMGNLKQVMPRGAFTVRRVRLARFFPSLSSVDLL